MPTSQLVFVLDRLTTPIGTIMVVTDEHHHLRALEWEDREHRLLRALQLHYGRGGAQLVSGTMPAAVRTALEAYFSGSNLTAIDAIPVTTGGTPFQRAVWAALRQIPAGQTVSYAELAGRIAKPRAVRAVGHANGSNPVSIVVPCHRLIGADRSLTGYGGGVVRKQWLLSHEGAEDVQARRSAAISKAAGKAHRVFRRTRSAGVRANA